MGATGIENAEKRLSHCSNCGTLISDDPAKIFPLSVLVVVTDPHTTSFIRLCFPSSLPRGISTAKRILDE